VLSNAVARAAELPFLIPQAIARRFVDFDRAIPTGLALCSEGREDTGAWEGRGKSS
jgi:hypothetical protein